jgi:hypothetical protein
VRVWRQEEEGDASGGSSTSTSATSSSHLPQVLSSTLRISFEEAITEPRLLKPRFDQLSLPQQVALKAAYGVGLSAEIKDAHGLSELDHWAISQESCTYDELGFPTSVTPVPYTPKAWREVWGIWGIRAGKTDTLASTVVSYEATCGGHEEWIRAGRKAVIFLIAQDLRLARFSVHGIVSTLQSMDFIYAGGGSRNRITQVTADRVDLWNGLTIMCIPPTVKSIRGYDAPVAVLDEVGVWYQDSDSANPDYEIYRNVSSRQAQFPDSKIIGISSPWNKGGLLYQRYAAGTNGDKLACENHRDGGDLGDCRACGALRRPHQNRLVLHATTAALANPLVRKTWLQEEHDKDPRAFARECLAKFQDSLSGFLSSALLEEAVSPGILERPPEPLNTYVAAIDPAFRQDAFGFCIGHASEDGVVVDLVRRWKSEGGVPLDPDTILAEIAPYLAQYRVATVYGDQYQFESLAKLALHHRFTIESVRFTATKKASIYGNLQQLVNSRRLKLVDHPETLQELMSLERVMGKGGTVQVAAPKGLHDDLATVVALMAAGAVWLTPQAAEPPPKEPTAFDLCQETIEKRRLQLWN